VAGENERLGIFCERFFKKLERGGKARAVEPCEAFVENERGQGMLAERFGERDTQAYIGYICASGR
jgi:hypothetical protein